MFFSSVAFHYKTHNVPAVDYFPGGPSGGTLIPYFGRPTQSVFDAGWKYFEWWNLPGIGLQVQPKYYIRNTRNQSYIKTIWPGQQSYIQINYTGTSGQHTGQSGAMFNGSIYADNAFTGRNSYGNDPSLATTSSGEGAAGAHWHSGGMWYPSNPGFTPQDPDKVISMATQNITFLQATKKVTKIPVNGLVFKETSIAGFIPFYANASVKLTGTAMYLAAPDENAYGVFGSNIATPGNYIVNRTGTAGGNGEGGHTHIGSSYNLAVSGQGYNTAQAGGDHTHPASGFLSQSSIDSLLLNLWKAVVATVPTQDMIVMYTGDLTKITGGWFLCDGNNGTVNIDESAVIGYSTGSAWLQRTTSNKYASGQVGVSSNSSHTHNAGQIIGGHGAAPAYHNSYAWNHNHTVTVSSNAFVPATINVAFIQYKG